MRWLRPDFQNPEGEAPGEAVATKKQPWPKDLPDQVRPLRDVLAAQSAPVSAEQIARQFTRAQTRKVEDLLAALIALGQARVTDADRYTTMCTVIGAPSKTLHIDAVHARHRGRHRKRHRSVYYLAGRLP